MAVIAEKELRDEKLDFWIQNNWNVLFIGRHGAGKTSRVIEAFERNKLSWKYFSGSTLDPWCDFVGVPKAVTRPDGSQYLDFVLPKYFQDNTIEAIFIDEYNRSHKKIRNAVMELIQYRSINGRKFDRLRLVWAAINPEEDNEYQVEPLDFAQKDRFHIQVNIPYKPSLDWFTKTFNEKSAKGAVAWWHELEEEEKKLVSPRRLEYALRIYEAGGDIKDVIPHSLNVNKLISVLAHGPAKDKLIDFYERKAVDEATKFLLVENNYAASARYLHELPDNVRNTSLANWMEFFLPLVTPEKLSSLVIIESKILDFVVGHIDGYPQFAKIIQNIVSANQHHKIVKRIKSVIGANRTLAGQFGNLHNISADAPFYSRKLLQIPWAKIVANLHTMPIQTTPQRVDVYQRVSSQIPQQLSEQDAIQTLMLFDNIASRSWARSLKVKMPHLMGIINHCINCIHLATGLSWEGILIKYGTNIQVLLSKIKEVDLHQKLFCPSKVKP